MSLTLLPDRVLDKILFEPNTGCWLWLASRFPTGYGHVWDERTKHSGYAHRYVYTRLVGPIPPGLTIDHLCFVCACVNPAHLEAVTIRVNILRGRGRAALAARRTHCPQGHPRTPENIYQSLGNRGRCRICKREQCRQYYTRKRRAA